MFITKLTCIFQICFFPVSLVWPRAFEGISIFPLMLIVSTASQFSIYCRKLSGLPSVGFASLCSTIDVENLCHIKNQSGAKLNPMFDFVISIFT